MKRTTKTKTMTMTDRSPARLRGGRDARRARMRAPLSALPLLIVPLAACLPSDDAPVGSGHLPLPAAVQALPAAGELSVSVYMNDEGEPRYVRAVTGEQGAIELEFTVPRGEQVFTVLFEYLDPQFIRLEGGPWELARWASGPVRVIAGEAVPLEITAYVYEDYDGDGISNLDEVIARTDPGDASDPGPGEPPDPGDGDPGGPEDPGGPTDPPEPVIVRPDGLWHGATQQDGTAPFAVLHGGRVLITAGNLLYAGDYAVGDGGAYAGEVDVFNTDGDRLTGEGRSPLGGVRAGADVLELAVAGVGALALELNADPAYRGGSSLERIAQSWTASRPEYTLIFPVDDNGVVTGAFDTRGCLYAGGFELLDAAYNVYAVTLELSGQTGDAACVPYAGSGYRGYASLVPDDDELRLIVAGESRAFALELGRRDGPPPAPPRGGAWAVAGGGHILRWDGEGWHAAARAPGALYGIHCTGPADCWAVGEGRRGRATILRWDGSDWSDAGFGNDTPDEDLRGVACIAADDCWAVGEATGRRANIVRWDGSSWSSAGFANDTPDQDLRAVACVSAVHCWAVGEDYRGRGFIVRWDGVAWSDGGFVNATAGQDLNGIACTSARDCWAVGETRRGGPVIARWDGDAWSEAPPADALPNRDLEAVSCLSATDCWAVGRKADGKGTLARWNGAAWTTSGLVNGAPDEDLAAVHCAAGACWAAGRNGTALRLEAGSVWVPHPASGEDLYGVFFTAD